MATTTDQPLLVRAQVRHLRCSARKARVILDHVRGMSVMQAQAQLQFSPRAAARDVLGLLKSATANARENHDIDQSELVIDHCYADEDRTLKRFKPRARGRASSIHKRMCHVTIVLRHVPVAAERDISAAQATIAAESRRTRPRRAVPGAARLTEALQETPGGDATDAEAAAARGRGDPRAQAQATRSQAQGSRRGRGRGEGTRGRGSQGAQAPGREARGRRRARRRRAEGGRSQGAPQEACPEAHRTGCCAADDAAEKTADEGDS